MRRRLGDCGPKVFQFFGSTFDWYSFLGCFCVALTSTRVSNCSTTFRLSTFFGANSSVQSGAIKVVRELSIIVFTTVPSLFKHNFLPLYRIRGPLRVISTTPYASSEPFRSTARLRACAVDLTIVYYNRHPTYIYVLCTHSNPVSLSQSI